MAHPILMPKPGQMTEECTLILWRKAEGEPVARGDVLFEIETDKSAMEVECWEEGVLLKQVVPEGTTVPVNAVCAWVGHPGDAIPETPAPAAAATPPAPGPATELSSIPTVGQSIAPPAGATPSTIPAPSEPAASSSSGAAGADGLRLKISPRASRLAAEARVDPRAISGTGPGARITEKDVQAALAARAAQPATPVAPAGPTPALAPAPDPAPIPITPTPYAPVRARAPVPANGETTEPMSRLRRVIADRLVQSWTTTPHFTVTVAVNMHRLLALRSDLKASGTNLSVTDFVIHAVAQTLAEFPDLNSRLDGASIVRHPRVHLGLAVSIPGGLLVPVIRDVDLLSVTDIHERSQALIDGARAGQLGPDELTGSTFTVSNLGMFGVEEFSAIINPGEGAILAVASAIPTPVSVGEGIAVRPIMKITLSADHRVVDGEMGARFLGALRRRLEDAEAFRNQALVG